MKNSVNHLKMENIRNEEQNINDEVQNKRTKSLATSVLISFIL
jgi:hypothetical protein